MRKIAIIFLILSFFGLIDAAYLTITHYQDVSVVCLLINTCDLVLQSSYATVGSIPVSLLGMVYYLGIFILSLISFIKKDEKLFFITALLTVFGFLASLWFLYVQLFIIHSLCFYCLFSAFDSIVLFILGLIFALKFNPDFNS
ncbi:MAG: vitamin K epoxide reductase family protein [Patescibacteria group bacterium]